MSDNVQMREIKGPNPWRIAGWGLAVSLIVLPFVAMQFTSEVNWTAFDFIFATIVLGSVGLGLELAVRKTPNLAFRGGAALGLLVPFLLIWLCGGVGIIGNENDRVNSLYMLVVIIALIGSIAVKAKAAPMAWVMSIAAVATLLVPMIGFMFEMAPREAFSRPEVPISTIVFTGMWLLSAALFRKAARD
jgi:hypothetical protein